MGTIRLELDAGPVRPAELDRACGDLADDLRRVRHVAVTRAPGTAVDGAKSPLADSLDTLLLTGTFSVAVVRAVRDVLLAYLKRGQARSVTVERGGARMVVTVASDEEVAAVTSQLDAILGADAPE
ncbi:MAG TPA: hypothetical protein VGN37_16490 [Actinocatenispora sp.]